MAANRKTYCLAALLGAFIGGVALIASGTCGNYYPGWTIPVYRDPGLDFIPLPPPQIAELQTTAILLRVCHLFVEQGSQFLAVPMTASLFVAYLWINFPGAMAYPEKKANRMWIRMLDNTLYAVGAVCFIGFMMGHAGVVVTRGFPVGSLGCALAYASQLCWGSMQLAIIPIVAALLSIFQESFSYGGRLPGVANRD